MSEPQTSTELEIIQPTALESLERANIDMQISTARRYPRSLAVVKKRMLDLATLDQETAESCFYRLNRQGKMIEGPSIRLAEIAVSSFGNLRYGARVIANDGKTITAQGYCHDLETNVMSQVEVQRRITNREGQSYSQDMQVVTGNAACAIAARNAVFKVVPFAFVKPIFTAAKEAAVGDIKTLAERRTKLLKTFAALGVNEKRICATLDKGGIEEIGTDELTTLIGLYNAIRDNEQSVEEAFPVPIEKPRIGAPSAKASDELNMEPPAEKPKRHRKPKEAVAGPATEAVDDPEDAKWSTLKDKCRESGFTLSDLLYVCVSPKNKWLDAPKGWNGTQEGLLVTKPEIPDDKFAILIENWEVIVKVVKGE